MEDVTLLLKTIGNTDDCDIRNNQNFFFLFQTCPTAGTDKNELQGDGFCRSQQSQSQAVSTSVFTLTV